MNLEEVQVSNAIASGHMALRVARDERDWLIRAIREGRKALRKAGL